MKTKVYMIRHTSVDVPTGTCYGQTDVPLKPTFKQEAAIVKEKLLEYSPDAVFSSPLSRCKQLADYCGYSDAELIDGIKELHFGDWEMKGWDEMNMDIWKEDWVTIPAPNGESFNQMYDRVALFLDSLKDKALDTVFIFTHGGVISCARVYFNHADMKETFELMPQYGEVVEFEL